MTQANEEVTDSDILVARDNLESAPMPTEGRMLWPMSDLLESATLTLDDAMAFFDQWGNCEDLNGLLQATRDKALWAVAEWLPTIVQHWDEFIEHGWVDLSPTAKGVLKGAARSIGNLLDAAGIKGE